MARPKEIPASANGWAKGDIIDGRFHVERVMREVDGNEILRVRCVGSMPGEKNSVFWCDAAEWTK